MVMEGEKGGGPASQQASRTECPASLQDTERAKLKVSILTRGKGNFLYTFYLHFTFIRDRFR